MMVKPSSKQERINKVKQEPHLSGAYIRNLVKHLTSIKTKHSFHGLPESPSPPPPPPPPPPHKKQIRRRHHTTKPSQERLLSMAQARREIVTALKFHRASIKQPQTANNNHPRPPQSSTATAAANLSTASPPPPPPLYDHHENLNFQDFKNLDSGFYKKPLISNYDPMSSSSSGGSRNLHHAMDDDEMEKIRLLSEQHQMEWNDTVNLLMFARWFESLKTIEIIESEDHDKKDDNLGFNLFDQVMEFPPW